MAVLPWNPPILGQGSKQSGHQPAASAARRETRVRLEARAPARNSSSSPSHLIFTWSTFIPGKRRQDKTVPRIEAESWE